MKLDKTILDSLDMSKLKEICHPLEKTHIDQPAGKEHYRLLAWLSLQRNGIMLADIGTRYGGSAISLAMNPDNQILTFDIKKQFNPPWPNIEFSGHNCVEDISPVLSCAYILVDVDPHDGGKEQKILDQLIDKKYNGIVLFDDIYWDNMKNFWDNITLEKYDVTKYGHASGTGLVNFSDEEIELI